MGTLKHFIVMMAGFLAVLSGAAVAGATTMTPVVAPALDGKAEVGPSTAQTC